MDLAETAARAGEEYTENGRSGGSLLADEVFLLVDGTGRALPGVPSMA